ncbi:hypothetical protein [Paenibacillus sp. YIM B09110]|uniref:hypothetical protein n=1 Tax=Paenibacillus sp. YIM B09110 TaxID=3126102 RepID=UPI00301D8312
MEKQKKPASNRIQAASDCERERRRQQKYAACRSVKDSMIRQLPALRRQQKAAPSEEQPMLGKWLCAALVHRFTSCS